MKDENGKTIKVTNSSKVECEIHGVVTTWGALDPIQQLAVESRLDTQAENRCLLLPRDSE